MNSEESSSENNANKHHLCSVAFVDARHKQEMDGERPETDSRLRMDERMKTLHVALVLCLNIGVDPPDVVKPQPCARMECWIDPLGISRNKAVETIGNALQTLYQRWQPRARYKLSLDPTVEDVKKLCLSLRRNAKEDRVLFHYNGHGVPKPTQNGEIWVFNKSYTQYIPLSIFDLQMWMGSPSVYVWDCNSAGQIIESFKQFGEQHDSEFANAEEYRRQLQNGLSSSFSDLMKNGSAAAPTGAAGHLHQHHNIAGGVSGFVRGSSAAIVEESEEFSGFTPPPVNLPNFKECIQLGACRADETLPMKPELPADLFTSCLTTPIKTAVMWYILQNNMTDRLPLDIVDKIPGQANDRRTLLGELNWIFTATTDTIAWHVLPRELFHKLFRQDLLVACLFRNFLLADRILRSYGCRPLSHPELPPTHEHNMWRAWDFALDVCLSQLIYSPNNIGGGSSDSSSLSMTSLPPQLQQFSMTPGSNVGSEFSVVENTHSPFFAIQLTAFEVWLEYGYHRRDPPLQLPIVLQVLLSQSHRIRALELLERFLDLGPWAINLALSVGIFSYVLKLLQSSAKDLRPHLTFIWAKILAVDPACQQDLVKEGGHRYFLQILNDPGISEQQKVVSAFVLSCILDNYTSGQEAVMQGGFISTCTDLLSECKSPLLRRWLAIGLGRQWSDFDAARWQGIRCCTYEKLYDLLLDPYPEIRAAAVYALGTLISNTAHENEHATLTDHSIALVLLQKTINDASPLVRRELVVALHWLVLNFKNQFVTVAYEVNEKRLNALNSSTTMTSSQYQQRAASFRLKKSNKAASADESDSAMTATNNGPSATYLNGQAFQRRRSSYVSIAENLCSTNLLLDHQKHVEFKEKDVSRSNSAQNLQQLIESPPTSTTISKFFGFGTAGSGGSSSTYDFAKNRQQKLPRVDDVSDLVPKLRSHTLGRTTSGNVYVTVWRSVLNLLYDPYPGIADLAGKLIDHVNEDVVVLHKTKIEAEMDEIIHKTMPVQEKPSSSSEVFQKPATDRTDSTNTIHTKPVFVIGSPGTDPQIFVPMPLPASEQNHSISKRNRLLMPKLDDVAGPTISMYSTMFTSPRRPIFGRKPSSNSAEPPPAAKKTGRKQAIIETNFVLWCCRRFTEPVLHLFQESASGTTGATGDNRNSHDYHKNVDCTKYETISDWALEAEQSMKECCERDRSVMKKVTKMEMQLFAVRNSRSPTCMQLFPYYPLLCVGEHHSISVWNCESGGHLLSTFDNDTNCSYAEISFIEVVNPTSEALIMTGTTNGEVRLWNSLFLNKLDWLQSSSNDLGESASGHTPRLVTAWNTSQIGFHKKPTFSVPTKYCWEQESALLMTGDGSNVIRIWDAHQEMNTRNIVLSSFDGVVTAIAADATGNHLFAAGCSDGGVRLFDSRLPVNEKRLTTLRDLLFPVVKIHVQHKSAGSYLIAGSNNGLVCVWDPRMYRDPVSLFQTRDHFDSNNTTSAAATPIVTAMDIHRSLELVALATSDHKVHVSNFSGHFVEPIQYQDGFMGQRLAPVNCLKFHAYKAELAFGTQDCLLAVFGFG